MVFRIGKKELERNILLDMLVILLLIVVFCILTVTGSSVVESTRKYRILSELSGSDGYYYGTELLMNQENRMLIWNRQCLTDILGEDIHVAAQYELILTTINQKEAKVWSYDWNVADSYRPSITRGRWFKKSDTLEDGEIYGVISDTGEYSVGDKIILRNGNRACPVEVVIIGLLEDSSSVFGYDNYSSKSNDYTDCFYTYNLEYEQMPLLLLLNDQLDLSHTFLPDEDEMVNEGYIRQQKGGLFLTWEGELGKERMEKLNQFMMESENMVYTCADLPDMKIRSKKVIRDMFSGMMPILLCVFILVILATVSVSTISVKKQLHNYAIYYICGLPWKGCLKISLVHSTMCSVIAFFIATAGIFLLEKLELFVGIHAKIGMVSFGICVLVQLIFIGISLIFPYHIIHNTSAKTILTKL